jgi:hypothetical protein
MAGESAAGLNAASVGAVVWAKETHLFQPGQIPRGASRDAGLGSGRCLLPRSSVTGTESGKARGGGSRASQPVRRRGILPGEPSQSGRDAPGPHSQDGCVSWVPPTFRTRSETTLRIFSASVSISSSPLFPIQSKASQPCRIAP